MIKYLNNNLVKLFIFVVLNVLLLYIIFNYSRDIESYKVLHVHAVKYNLNYLLNSFYYEPLFLIIYYYLSNIFNFYDLFIIISSLCLFIKVNLLIKIDKNYYLSIFLYVFLQFLAFHEASQMRTAIATCFILYAIVSENKNFLFYLALAFIGVLFHKVCIIILALYSLRFLMLMVIPGIIFFLFQDFIIVSLQGIIDLSAYHSPNYGKEKFNAILPSASITNSFFWSLLLISFFSFLDFKNLNFFQKKGLYTITIGCAFYLLFIDSANISSRFIEVCMIGVIPLVCSKKINFDLKWIATYFLVGYIVVYQTTNMSLSIIIG
jgi:hypothetical protein